MPSSCAASFGATSSCRACSVGPVLADDSPLKTSCTRVSNWPLFSSATSVLSNVGGAGLSAMAAISAIWAFMPASNAGLKSASLILSNCGAPNGRGLGDMSGLLGVAAGDEVCMIVMEPADQVETETAPTTTAPARTSVKVRGMRTIPSGTASPRGGRTLSDDTSTFAPKWPRRPGRLLGTTGRSAPGVRPFDRLRAVSGFDPSAKAQGQSRANEVRRGIDRNHYMGGDLGKGSNWYVPGPPSFDRLRMSPILLRTSGRDLKKGFGEKDCFSPRAFIACEGRDTLKGNHWVSL